MTEKLNQRPFRKLPGTREELYRSVDLPALEPLPAQSYVFAEWKRARVNIDYHIDLEQHYYVSGHQKSWIFGRWPGGPQQPGAV
jgi:hypothetical protein